MENYICCIVYRGLLDDVLKVRAQSSDELDQKVRTYLNEAGYEVQVDEDDILWCGDDVDICTFHIDDIAEL